MTRFSNARKLLLAFVCAKQSRSQLKQVQVSPPQRTCCCLHHVHNVAHLHWSQCSVSCSLCGALLHSAVTTQPRLQAGRWATLDVPFTHFRAVFRARSRSDAPPLDPAHITSLQIMLSKFEYDGELNPHFRAGRFELPIHDVRAYLPRAAPPRFVLLSSAGAHWPLCLLFKSVRRAATLHVVLPSSACAHVVSALCLRLTMLSCAAAPRCLLLSSAHARP